MTPTNPSLRDQIYKDKIEYEEVKACNLIYMGNRKEENNLLGFALVVLTCKERTNLKRLEDGVNVRRNK